MMGEIMQFPETVEEFMQQYKITDTQQVYTNGTELVPIFRMKQWFEAHKQRWIPCSERMPDLIPCNAGTAYSEAVNVWTTGRKIMVGVWDGTGWIAPYDFWEAWDEQITHWMPLHELPEEENDETIDG